MTIETRQFYRRLIGLTPGVTEEDFLHARQFGQFVRQLFLLRHAIEIRRMQQSSSLRGNRRNEIRMVVAQRTDGNSRQPV